MATTVYGERFQAFGDTKLRSHIERLEKQSSKSTRKGQQARPRPSQMKKRSDEQRTGRFKAVFMANVMQVANGRHMTRVPDIADDSLGNQNGNVLMMLQRNR